MSTQPNRSTSRARSRSPLSRPTTPLRPSSRSSFRASQSGGGASSYSKSQSLLDTATPLDDLEPQFAELSDSMADLEANFMHLQIMHESLARFGESFASFLYGLNMNAFIIDFPEQPLTESIQRFQAQQKGSRDNTTGLGDQSTAFTNTRSGTTSETNPETTFMTADTSFASVKATPKRKSYAPSTGPASKTTNSASTTAGGVSGLKRPGIPSRTAGSARGGSGIGRGIPRGAARGASGLPTRGRGRGVR